MSPTSLRASQPKAGIDPARYALDAGLVLFRGIQAGVKGDLAGV